MAFVEPVTLEGYGLRVLPLALEHEAGLRAAAADGALWTIRVTSVPEPENTHKYIEDALAMREAGNRFAFVVQDAASGKVLGCSSYHDILPAVKRVEIGYTWYAKSVQRTHVNTACKLLLAEDIPAAVLQSQELKTALPPLAGALLKNEQDVTLFEKLMFMQRHNR